MSLRRYFSWALVTDVCNPSYSRVCDQEDCCSKPAQGNSSEDPISKQPIKERAGGVAEGVGLEFKSQKHTKNVLQIQRIYSLVTKFFGIIEFNLSKV
jgi:hypothetical protein